MTYDEETRQELHEADLMEDLKREKETELAQEHEGFKTEEDICDHEINLTECEWMFEGCMAIAECEKCGQKFRGLLLKY